MRMICVYLEDLEEMGKKYFPDLVILLLNKEYQSLYDQLMQLYADIECLYRQCTILYPISYILCNPLPIIQVPFPLPNTLYQITHLLPNHPHYQITPLLPNHPPFTKLPFTKSPFTKSPITKSPITKSPFTKSPFTK